MNISTGKLIIINGGSSTGKTSVAREFQELALESWMPLGIDAFWRTDTAAAVATGSHLKAVS